MHSVEQICYTVDMSKEYLTPSEMGKRGAAVSNARRTTEQRRKAALKGWKKRKKHLKDKKK